jgi:peptidoglycan hydrolase-like protein with peptidoglycan-binding domain
LDSNCQEGDGGLGCADSTDNDGDSFTDCSDSSCSAAVACDVTAPTLLAFFSTSTNGTYVAGQTLTVFARFSEAVSVSSTMTVSLDSGGTVSLAATSSESTLLRGVYAVAAGHSSADLAASSIDAASVADLNANAYSPSGLPGTNISDGSAIAISAIESAACADSIDNDADGDVDCEDSQCDGVGSCEHGAEESCADSTDNDGDGLADCADADCADYFACGASETAGECGNSVDDDGDSYVDCADSDCAYLASCGGTESSCADGADNDGDGSTDCADAECASGDTCDASPRQSSGRRARQSERAAASSLPAAVDLNGNGVIEPSLGEVVTSRNVEALFGFAGGEDAVANPTLVASLGCDPYLTATLGRGRLNPPAQVSKLQTILNALVSITLPVTGLFDEATESAVKAFQLEHEDVILRPWGEELCPGGVCQPTGVVGLTTRRFINKLVCGF